jgi:hypothetical protein
MKKLKLRADLRKRALELGVSIQDPSLFKDEQELQRRVMEAERHRREASLWLLALA